MESVRSGAGIEPVTVNLHITQRCNYRCSFCYGTFTDVPGTLGRNDWRRLIAMLREAPPILGRYRIDKLTFAGGEPTLVPYLPALIRLTDELEFVASLVTNGTGVTDEFLALMADYLRWIAFSIDSADEEVNRAIGRGRGDHVRQALAAIRLVQRHERIRLKLNTVVHALNWREDLHPLVREVRPDRWKVLQATAIKGQNDGAFPGLAVTDAQFREFRERHRDLHPVCESEDDIRGSYLMIDPLGRFFGNATGTHVYSPPVLAVGVERAIEVVGWSPEKFLARGGSYEWRQRPADATDAGDVSPGAVR